MNTDNYIPAETEEEELIKRKKEREALLLELQRKKKEQASQREKTEDKMDCKSENNETVSGDCRTSDLSNDENNAKISEVKTDTYE